MTVMLTQEQRENRLAPLWGEHGDASLPERSRRWEPLGVNLITLDYHLTGCVSCWLRHGELDAPGRRALDSCRDDLTRVVPVLTDTEEHDYFDRLLRLAERVGENRG